MSENDLMRGIRYTAAVPVQMTARTRLIHYFVAAMILALLPSGCQSREFTLTVFGEDEADGASVYVNGRLVGTMAGDGERGPYLSMMFPRGTLTVEVKKEGYLPFLQVLTVTSRTKEQEIHVTLSRDAAPEDASPEVDQSQSQHPSVPSPGKLPICPD